MKTLGASVIGLLLAVLPVSAWSDNFPAWIERLGWTLVHSVWQLIAVAIIAAIVDRGLRRRTANARYFAAVTKTIYLERTQPVIDRELLVIDNNGKPDVDVLSLGPEEDWFVRVMKFENNGAFEYQTEYHRIANPVVKSLRYFHYANSNGWSHGPEKISRLGRLYFDFPSVQEKLAGDAVGKSPDGTPALPRIFWDGDQNRFSGAAAQHVNNKPLYQVDVDWSRDFEALTPKLNQTVVAGGASADGHWHHWETIVPEKHELLLTLTVPQREGPAKVIEKRFGPGYRLLQLGFQLEKDAPAASLLLLIGKDGKDLKETFELPQQLGDRPATHPPITHLLNPGESARVLSRTLKSSTESVTLDVKLLAR